MHHGAAGVDCRAAQGLQLTLQVDDAIVDGVLDDRQLLADGVDEVRRQLAAQEACAHVFEVGVVPRALKEVQLLLPRLLHRDLCHTRTQLTACCCVRG